MSDYTSSSVSGYTEPSRAGVLAEAGLQALGSIAAAVFTTTAALAGKFHEAMAMGMRDIQARQPSMPFDEQHALASLEAFDRVPELETLARAAANHGELSMLDRLPSASPLDRLAAGRTIEALTNRTVKRLADAESRVLEQTTRAALGDVGFTPKRSKRRKDGSVVMSSTRADGRAAYVVLNVSTGQVALDLAGPCGGACADDARKFFAAMARRGTRVTFDDHSRHNIPGGGVLAQDVKLSLADCAAEPPARAAERITAAPVGAGAAGTGKGQSR